MASWKRRSRPSASSGPLCQLPPELLHEIVQHLGSCFFRADLQRLSLHSAWYAVARPVFLEELHLCNHKVRRLLSDPNAESLLSDFNRYTRHLTLVVGCERIAEREPVVLAEFKDKSANTTNPLKRLKEWAQSHAIYPVQGQEVSPTIDPIPAYFQKRKLIQEVQWKNRELLNTDLVNLAHALRDNKRLVSLRYLSTYITLQYPSACPMLDSAALRAQLTLSRALTVLDLTLDYRSEDDDSAHICPLVGKQIPTLQSLRLHLFQICPKVLEFDASIIKNLPLRKIIVRLDVGFELHDLESHAAVPANCCSRAFTGQQLNETIESQVRQLAQLMPQAEIACVMSARGPIGDHGFYLTLYNALEDTTTCLTSVFEFGLLESAQLALQKNEISL